MYETNTTHFDKKFIDELSADTGHPFINDITSFEELMMMYSCAIKEVQTKLEVLNMDFGVRYRRNPIEFIKTRLKRPDSIAKKLKQKGCPITVSAIGPNLNDVAGIRVICSFIDDIYAVAEQLIGQDDITLIEKIRGFGTLKPGLRQVAELRLEYPDASLLELGQMLVPPLGKSGVNHRLRKLGEIADSIRDESN